MGLADCQAAVALLVAPMQLQEQGQGHMHQCCQHCQWPVLACQGRERVGRLQRPKQLHMWRMHFPLLGALATQPLPH